MGKAYFREEMAKIHQSRIKSDADVIKDGAHMTPAGEIDFTAEQKKSAVHEMQRSQEWKTEDFRRFYGLVEKAGIGARNNDNSILNIMRTILHDELSWRGNDQISTCLRDKVQSLIRIFNLPYPLPWQIIEREVRWLEGAVTGIDIGLKIASEHKK